MSFRISTVATITGIPRNTLIAWERRYGLLEPQRQANGYRSYSDKDVALLLRLKNALNTGLKISEAIDLIRAQASAPSLKKGPSHASAGQVKYSLLTQTRADLFDALVAFDGAGAQLVLAQCLTIPFTVRLQQIYFPLMRSIGNEWEAGRLSIAQEHFASGIIRAHLATLFINSSQSSLRAPHAACTTLPHDEHEIAALALSIQLSNSGFRVSYLGPRLPINEVVNFCTTQKPALLCVSCITLPPDYNLADYLAQLVPIVQLGTRVVLGGTILQSVPQAPPVEIIPNWQQFSP